MKTKSVSVLQRQKPAGSVGWVEDLVVEDGEIEGEAEADGVRWGQLRQGEIRSGFVGHQAVLCCFLSVVARGKLCQVPVVVTLPGVREIKVAQT